MFALELDFHGVTARVSCDDPAPIEQLRHDFSLFERSNPPLETRTAVELTCHVAAPPWGSAPSAPCVMVQPTCVVYQAGGDRWVDYQGAALVRWCRDEERGALWSTDLERMHEIAYLLLLSRVGELLDQRGLHRVHAAGFAVDGRGVLCLLPSGGGKTTLLLQALGDRRVRVLSDDTPLLTRRGELLAWPSRIGCIEAPRDVDARFVRTAGRRGGGSKHLVDMAAFADRLASRAAPAAVVLGERLLAGPPRLQRAPRAQVAAELFRSLVVGLGLPQVVEYFLQQGGADLWNKAAIAASRAAASAALLARARFFRLGLSRDRDANARVLAQLLDEVAAA